MIYKVLGTFIVSCIMLVISCQNNKYNNGQGTKSLTQIPDTLIYATPQEANMSESKLKKAKNIFVNAVKNNKVLGYQILVARDGKIVLHEAGGLRDFENKLPMNKNTLLNLASNTKSLTAIAILQLVDQGKISLDDSVSKYLPGFDSNPANKITIKQLLLHKSGYMGFDVFHEGVTPYSEEETDAPSLIVEAKEIGRFGPEIEPGIKYRYSNLGYNILGAIVEEVSQKKLDKYFEDNIYKPLGMNHTSNLLISMDTTIVSKQYYFFEGKWQKMGTLSPPFAYASGGTISNAWDFAKVFQMLVNKGTYNGYKILEEKTVAEATSPLLKVPEAYLSEEIEKELGLPSSEWYEYRDSRDMNIDKHRGYGFVISDNGGYSHAGIYGTFAYADPFEKLVIIIFTQSIYGGNPGQEFIDMIYEALNN